MIKLNTIGITGKTYNRIKDFLFNRFLQIRIGTVISGRYIVDNGTPQGNVISSILFSVMINYVFSQVQDDIDHRLPIMEP